MTPIYIRCIAHNPTYLERVGCTVGILRETKPLRRSLHVDILDWPMALRNAHRQFSEAKEVSPSHYQLSVLLPCRLSRSLALFFSIATRSLARIIRESDIAC